ncbi:hypothetical protein RCL1_000623 [Eukaryota sp. TZLM3-RCL]
MTSPQISSPAAQTPRRLALKQAHNISSQLISIDQRLDTCLDALNSRFAKLLSTPPHFENETDLGWMTGCSSRFDTIVSLRHYVDASLDRANRLVQDDSRWKKNLAPQHMLSLLLSGNLTRTGNTELTLAALELNSGRRLHDRVLRHRPWAPGPTTLQHEAELEKFCKKKRKDLKVLLKKTLRKRKPTTSDVYSEQTRIDDELSLMEMEDVRSNAVEQVKKEQEKARILATEQAALLLAEKEDSLKRIESSLSENFVLKTVIQEGRLSASEVQNLIEKEQQSLEAQMEEEKKRLSARKAAQLAELEACRNESERVLFENLMAEHDKLSQYREETDSRAQKREESLRTLSHNYELEELARLSARNTSDLTINSEDFVSFVHEKLTRAKQDLQSFVDEELSSSSSLPLSISMSPNRTSDDLTAQFSSPKMTSTKIKELLRHLSEEVEGESREERDTRLEKLAKLKRILKKRLAEKRGDQERSESESPSYSPRLRASSFSEFLSSTTEDVVQQEEEKLEIQQRVEDVNKSIEDRQNERTKRRELKKNRMIKSKSLLSRSISDDEES